MNPKYFILSLLICLLISGSWSQSILAQKTEDPELLQRITVEAERSRIQPLNAKLDSVWHAIPGYNGLEVDIEKTYKAAQMDHNKASIPYAYREIIPQVNLADLGPQPIYRGNPQKNMVSFMINVAWGDEFIPSILATLEKEHIHATFFLDGSWLKKHIDTAKHIASLGHELSNHAYSHKKMSQISNENAVAEIRKTEDLLNQQVGVKNHLFAPPSGDYNMETVKLAAELQLKTILWTLDTVDWTHPSPSSIIQKIAAKITPGTTILMHPTDSSSQALPGMIREIRRKGLLFGTVSELISTDRVPLINKVTQNLTTQAIDVKKDRRYYEARGDIVWEVPTKENIIALTFDDGPDPVNTPRILKLLAQYEAKATFFTLGHYVEEYPDLVKREVLEGHELGNHTYTHAFFKRTSQTRIHQEMLRTQQAIFKATGVTPRLFRPPGGYFNDAVVNAAKQENLKVIMWSWDEDTRDWSKPGINKIVKKVVNNAHNGDIILFHDFANGNTSQTLEALKQVLPVLQKRGYRFVTVSDLLNQL